jgi:hypothetical protein
VEQARNSLIYLYRSRWKRNKCNGFTCSTSFASQEPKEETGNVCSPETLIYWTPCADFRLFPNRKYKYLSRRGPWWRETLKKWCKIFNKRFKICLLLGEKSVRTEIMSKMCWNTLKIASFSMYVVSSHVYHSPLTEDLDSTWFNSWEMKDLRELNFYRD